MVQPRLHPDQLDVGADDVRRLLADQCPPRALDRVVPVRSTGTVNAVFRVGDDALARLPIMAAWSDVAAETATLRVVAPHLPVRVPRVLHVGRPDAGYGQSWLLLDWIEGDPASPGHGGAELADDLAAFLRALWTIPTAGARAGYRVSLERHRDAVAHSFAEADGILTDHGIDAATLRAVWSGALQVPAWSDAPRWTHSDLLAGNVLLDGAGRLSAVIDWEAAGAGDPACDLMSAWSLLDGAGRARLSSLLELDEDAWLRGRGWALAQAIIALPYYRETRPAIAAHSLHVLREIVAS
ncbi:MULTISPECIES: aminoglycoside phosphotransferase family protein [unclassified Microbacterium]|uniref:aminoglycoside phosphotransferase family protein n=1 Tax=unclassified Microbacterium TaxID=2609290 RepID=UPI00386AAAA5